MFFSLFPSARVLSGAKKSKNLFSNVISLSPGMQLALTYKCEVLFTTVGTTCESAARITSVFVGRYFSNFSLIRLVISEISKKKTVAKLLRVKNG